jgi:hypothetical protein
LDKQSFPINQHELTRAVCPQTQEANMPWRRVKTNQVKKKRPAFGKRAKSKTSKQSRPKKAAKRGTKAGSSVNRFGKKIGEETNKEISEAADEINGEYRNTTQGLLRLADRCVKWDKKFNKAAKEALIAKLLFNKSTFSMMIKIGNDPRLAKIPELLPPSYSIMYEVAQLDDEKLETARKDGTLHPNVTRKQIQDLRKKPAGGNGAESEQEDDDEDQEGEKSKADEEYDDLSARWEKYLKPHFGGASKEARDRLVDKIRGDHKLIGTKNK